MSRFTLRSIRSTSAVSFFFQSTLSLLTFAVTSVALFYFGFHIISVFAEKAPDVFSVKHSQPVIESILLQPKKTRFQLTEKKNYK